MTDETPSTGTPPAERDALKVELDPLERRVLGTLIEKNLTTPDYYPLTLKALTTGANQKNNRDPVTSYTEDEVQAGLSLLQGRKMVMAVRPEGGHATRWRHELDRKFGIQGRELAVLGELLLRGPQTEGELRARASRMRAFPDLEALHETLTRLREWTPSLVVRVSAEGAVRGVRHAHTLYPAAEMEEIRKSEGASADAGVAHAAPASSGASSDVSHLRARVAELESRLARIETLLNDELGASFPATEGAARPSATAE